MAIGAAGIAGVPGMFLAVTGTAGVAGSSHPVSPDPPATSHFADASRHYNNNISLGMTWSQCLAGESADTET